MFKMSMVHHWLIHIPAVACVLLSIVNGFLR